MRARPSSIHLFLITLLLASCALIQPSPGAAYQDAMTNLTATRTMAAQAIQQNKISKAEGSSILNQTDAARKILDEAAKVLKTDEKGAKAKIDSANQLIKPINDRLKKLLYTTT